MAGYLVYSWIITGLAVGVGSASSAEARSAAAETIATFRSSFEGELAEPLLTPFAPLIHSVVEWVAVASHPLLHGVPAAYFKATAMVAMFGVLAVLVVWALREGKQAAREMEVLG